jgi:peptidoglycan-associated lipoprotein
MKIAKILSLCAMGVLFSACSTTKIDQGCSVSSSSIRPGSAEDFKSCVKDRVFFAFDSSKISDDALPAIEAMAKWLKMYGCPKVIISGRCDARGTREYNLALGERRAHALKEALVKHGVKADRIHVVSFGKDKPVAEGNNEEAYALNRVAVVDVE